MRIVRALLSAAKTADESALAKFLFKTGYYNQLGLKSDDLFIDLDAEVKEAIRRLPDDVRNERVYRIKRACQLSLTQSILPKEEWTKMEEDDRYLLPYIQEVSRENEEKRNWGSD